MLRPDNEREKEFFWSKKKKKKKSSKNVKFDVWFRDQGKAIKNGEATIQGKEYETQYVIANENESIVVPKGAVILGAYYGDPKNLSRGKNVTSKVLNYVRKEGMTKLWANAEWFGDPWYGSQKQLQIKLAVVKGSEADLTLDERDREREAATKFDEYFKAIGDPVQGEQSQIKVGVAYDRYYLTADENETLEIPKNSLILGAYFGHAKDFERGKDVTREVLEYVRRKGFKTLTASIEWFGDPWYGTRKTLYVKIAMIEDASTEISIERGEKGKWGISYDHELHLKSVNAWARLFGLRKGLKIVAVEGNSVRTDAQLVRAVAGKKSVRVKVQGPSALVKEAESAAAAHAKSKRRKAEEKRAKAEAERQAKERERRKREAEAERKRLAEKRKREEERIRREEEQSGCKNVAALLKSIGLDNRVALFAKESVDFETLKELTENDFREMGLRIGERKRLARKIRDLTKKKPDPPRRTKPKPVPSKPKPPRSRVHVPTVAAVPVVSTARPVPTGAATYPQVRPPSREPVTTTTTTTATYPPTRMPTTMAYPQAHHNAVDSPTKGAERDLKLAQLTDRTARWVQFGDILWGRQNGFPWWPVLLCDPVEMRECIPVKMGAKIDSNRKKGIKEYLVFFYGTLDYCLLKIELLSDWSVS
eukprot:g2667.t1